MKTLTEADLDEYTIFDVIMPLPGTDVAYPGSKLGERYREFLRIDGLNPDDFVRKQRYILFHFHVSEADIIWQGLHTKWVIS